MPCVRLLFDIRSLTTESNAYGIILESEDDMNLSEKLVGVKRTKQASIKPFAGADESKSVTLVIDYSDCTGNDVLDKAASHDVIGWQATGRKNYNSIADGGIVNISAKSPGRQPQVDPEVAQRNKIAAMKTREEREAYVKKLLAEAEALAKK